MRASASGERTALNFPDESPGILKPWRTWGTEKYTVAYGQGVASSPIQLVSAVNAIANDGVYVAPKLVEGSSTPRARSSRCRSRSPTRSSAPRSPTRCSG